MEEVSMKQGMHRVFGIALVALGLMFACGAHAQAPQRSVTQGLAKKVVEDLYQCPDQKVTGLRLSAVGTIKSSDGKEWTVPAPTALQKKTGPIASDLFNQCTHVTPAKASDVKTDNVPVIEVDADGEVVTGYIVADNYYELYVNGKLVSVDPIPYTPANSTIVKFKAKRPYTYAFYLVDWEEDMGVGSEKGAVDRPKFHQGDGGLIARFSDGTVTDSTWKAQSFYIAPLKDPKDVQERGSVHDTGALGRVHPYAPQPGCQDQCYAVHYEVPANWAAKNFDDSKWPRAYEFTDDEVGVDHVPGYTRYPELFEGSRWIWSFNLVYDNLVLARKTVR
jgi:hypothetical protein